MGMKNILHLFSISRAFSVHSVLFHFMASKVYEQVQGKRDQCAKETLSPELDMGCITGQHWSLEDSKRRFCYLKKKINFFRLTYKMDVRKLIFIHVIEEAI